MGNQGAKPSTYVAKQWIDDRDSASCHMCCKPFSAPLRRRHHCRCCGEIFCADCWGAAVKLPADYGYTKEVPVCTACEALFHGKLKYLRRPRRIVLTRALKSNRDMNRPPLCREFQEARSFEVFFTKIAHWRPLNDRTNLLFAVTLRTVNTNNSSYFNAPVQAASAALPPGPIGAAVSYAIKANKTSTLDLNEIRTKRRELEDLSDDDECTPSPQPSSASNSTNRNGASGPAKKSVHLQVDTPEPSHSTKLRPHINGDVQLDVAWSLPLDAVLSVALDAHPEGDFISIETYSEIYRVQVAEADAVTVEQQHKPEVAFRIGARHTTPATAAPVQQANDDEEDDEDEATLTSRPRKNTRFRLLPAETNGLYFELQDALRLMAERSRHRQENNKESS